MVRFFSHFAIGIVMFVRRRCWTAPFQVPSTWSSCDSSTAPTEIAVSSFAPPETDENKKNNKYLDESEDSNRKMARFFSHFATGILMFVRGRCWTALHTPTSSFEYLKLSPELLKGLYVEMKFQKPSKIKEYGSSTENGEDFVHQAGQSATPNQLEVLAHLLGLNLASGKVRPPCLD